MLAMIRRHVAANLVGYLALAVATSGTAYAAAITGADVVNDSLTGADVKESTLAQVPKALLAGKRIKYQDTRPIATYAPDKVVDFRGLEIRVYCVNQFAVLGIQARSTISGAAIDWFAAYGDIPGPGLTTTTQGGQTLQKGTWVNLQLMGTNGRGLYEVQFRFPDGLVTADFVLSLVSGPGGYTCRMNGVLGGV